MPIPRLPAALLLFLGGTLSHAATVWTGPTVNFTQSASTHSDVVLPGKVVLTRGLNDVLYNTAAGESFPGPASPADTEWGFGSLNNFATLTYQSLESLRDGDLAARLLNKQMVMHIKTEDIYLSVMFTAWGQHGTSGFAYTRSTPAVAVSPSVSITSPASGTSFPAPASVELTSDATVSGGTVTNVQYFAGATSLGRSTTPPFLVTASLPSAGAYDVTAVATAAGISSTSAAVHITVIASPAVALTEPANGAVFAAPADLTLAVNATVSGGQISNVSFFSGPTFLGAVQTAPFSLVVTNLGAGSYPLTAVATAGGLSSTSAVVNVTILAAASVALSQSSIGNGVFTFNYNVAPGLRYVVEASSNLVDWTPVSTNVPSASPASFSAPLEPSGLRYYRVGRAPNPR